MGRSNWVTFAAIALTALWISACRDPNPTSGTLEIWQTETDPTAKTVLEQVELEFERQHPGVDVRIESVPWGSLSGKLSTAIESGSPPDLAHVEPFMAYSLVDRGLLSPIDDVIRDIERENGRILPAVRDLQLFGGRRYGIAYAVGITGWTFDTAKARGIPLPYPAGTTGTVTEEQFFAYLRSVRNAGGEPGVLLPGGTPFFIDQLFAELVANNGGRLYDPKTGRWLLDSPEAERALSFFVRLKQEGLLATGWQAQSYNDQFARLASDPTVHVTPVTYARARAAIASTLKDGPNANASRFRFMSPPVQVNGRQPIATIDAEPFVIFNSSTKERIGGKSKRDLAADFLRLFYSRKNYVKFVRSVPIHLTPIFARLAEDPDYTSSIGDDWQDWHAHTMAFLVNPNLTRPILVPGPSAEGLAADLQNPHLLALQADGVISSAVTEALTSDDPNVRAILRRAQERATRMSSAR